MNSHIHSLVVADTVGSRIQDATNQRLARELRRQQRETRRSEPDRRHLPSWITARA